MLGFAELFVAWVPIAIWGGWLSRRDGAPRVAGLIPWGTGALLGLCVAGGVFALAQALGAPPPHLEPTEPTPAPTIGSLELAIYGAHAVVGLGYVAMLGVTGAWLTKRR